jgi:hypothetical protein
MRVGVQSMEEIRKKRRLEWYGHVKRVEEYRLSKKSLEMKVTKCKRLRLGQKQGWKIKLN